MNRKDWIRGRRALRYDGSGKISVKFTKVKNPKDSYWRVYVGEKLMIKATLEKIWGSSLNHMPLELITTNEYGKEIIRRIKEKGLSEVSYLLTGSVLEKI